MFHLNIVNSKYDDVVGGDYIQYTEPLTPTLAAYLKQNYYNYTKHNGENVTQPVTIRIIE